MSAHVHDDRAVTRSVEQDPPPGPTRRSALGGQRGDRRLGALVAIVLAVAWGLTVGWWTPRGPLTSSAAIWSHGAGLVDNSRALALSRQ